MSLQEVSAKVTKDSPRAGIDFVAKLDLPDSIEEALAREQLPDGDENKWPVGTVYSRFMASIIIDVQAFMRSQITKDNATPESVAEAVAKWKPGLKARGKSPIEKIQDLLSRLSEDERAALLADLAS